MLRTDLGFLKPHSLPIAVFDHAAGSGSIGSCICCLKGRIGSNELAHQLHYLILFHSIFLQYLGCHAGSFLQKANEKMLRTHIAVV